MATIIACVYVLHKCRFCILCHLQVLEMYDGDISPDEVDYYFEREVIDDIKKYQGKQERSYPSIGQLLVDFSESATIQEVKLIYVRMYINY